MSESEFLQVTAKVARILYPKFGSIHGTREDFAQEVVVWCLQALPKYDPTRLLDSFLFTVARTRAMNAVRDKVTRNDPPCPSCHAGEPCTPDGCCRRHRDWVARNSAKASLARPRDLSEITEAREATKADSSVESEAAARELTTLLDRHLPVDLRADYLRLLAGKRLSKARRSRLRQIVADIIEGAGPSEYEGEDLEEEFLTTGDLSGEGEFDAP